MNILETKDQLTLKELLRIAYESGNDHADMPADNETVEEEFNEWFDDSQDSINKLIWDKKLTQVKKNKVRVLKRKINAIEVEITDYMENYIEPLQNKLKAIELEINKIELK